jgi:hypothetical protein
MSQERRFRGGLDGHERPFDWRALAKKYGIAERAARELYEEAVRQAGVHREPRRHQESIYLELLEGARQQAWRPSPGKVTHTMRLQAERAGKQRRSNISPLTGQPIAAGKRTLTSYIDPAHGRRNETHVSDELTRLGTALRAFTPDAIPVSEESSADTAMRLYEASIAVVLGDVDALEAHDRELLADEYGIDVDVPRPDEADEDTAAQPLPEPTRESMERAFGQRFDDVVVHLDSPEVTGDMHAFTRGREIHFRAGAFAPGTRRGDHIIAHELAHIVQQSGAQPTSVQARREGRSTGALEADADRAAMQALLGHQAAVQFHSSYGQVQAYRGAQSGVSEQPEEEQDETTAPLAEPGAEPAGAESATPVSSEDEERGTRDDAANQEAAGLEDGTEAAGDEDERAASREPERAAEQAPGAAAEQAAGPDGASSLGGMGAGAAGGAGSAAAAFSMKADTPGDVLASLRDAPASRALDALGQAQGLSAGVLSKQRDTAQEALPKIETPTGLLPQGASGPAAQPPPVADGAASSARGDRPSPVEGGGQEVSQEGIVPEVPPAPAPAPTQLAGRDDSASEEGQSDPALARSAQRALGSVGAPVDRVPTRAEDTPRVDVSGEADPAQLQSSLQDSQQQTAQARTQAAAETRQDFGEHDIFPEPDDEILEAQTQLSEPKLAGIEEAGGSALPAEAMASIDAEASPILQERIGKEQARYAEGEQQYDSDSQAAHEQARDDVQTLEEDTRAQQEQAQATASDQVTGARQEWQDEIDGVQADFQTKAGDARSEHQQKIQTEEQSGNREATRHIADAEQKAELEKRKAKDDVAREKESKSKESKGFWGWVKSKAKALVDGLKQAVNFIYDNLRKAVKALFEAAKRLALAAIDLARKAIVGLIKAYGAILKGLVRIALAAFPEIRDRILKRIDQAVNAATDLVNKAAEMLKKGVSAVLDFLASTIDKILGLIQDLYNAVFTIIGMIISGELKEILERLGNLIDAAKTAPGQFETAAYEELLGGNLDQPLSPAELMAAGRTPPASAAGAEPAGGMEIAQGEADGDAPLPSPPWTEENVGVDAVASGEELSPELSEQLLEMTGGGDGEVTFGESEDGSRSLESILGIEGQAQTSAQTAQGQTGAGQQAAYTDGLSPRERAGVKWEAMKKGLADWWSQNWPYVLAGGVLAVAGFIVANILTGGAILAALPAIMTAVGYIFAGLLVVQLAGHLRDFLQKGWNGDIQGGGKSLAKGLAAGAIELIMLLTFKVGSVALKGAKAAAKGVAKGARAVARGTANVARGAMRIARRGAQYVLKGGKVLLRGVGQGISRGVKRLRDLGARLLQRTRFKGFRIRIQARRFRLEGKINPWVVLAEGKIVEVDARTEGARRLSNEQLTALRKSDDPDAFLKQLDIDDAAKAGADPAKSRHSWPDNEPLENFADRMRAELNKAKREYDRLRNTSPLSEADAKRLKELEDEILPALSKDVNSLENARQANHPPRADARDVPNTVKTANGLDVEIPPSQLDHILDAHTIENFDPVKRLTELASEPPTHITSFFPARSVTNQRELFTLLKQALGGKGGRFIKATGNNKLTLKLRGLQLEGWVGPKSGGGLKANSLYVKGGQNTVTKAQIQAYANAVTSGTRSLDDIRRELAARFARGF